MNKIVWSDSAKINFRNTIDYLFEKWTIKEVKNFKNKVQILTENISKNISFCPYSKINNLRKCKIGKNNFLIYLAENEVIYIVTIVNSRSFHQY